MSEAFIYFRDDEIGDLACAMPFIIHCKSLNIPMHYILPDYLVDMLTMVHGDVTRHEQSNKSNIYYFADGSIMCGGPRIFANGNRSPLRDHLIGINKLLNIVSNNYDACYLVYGKRCFWVYQYEWIPVIRIIKRNYPNLNIVALEYFEENKMYSTALGVFDEVIANKNIYRFDGIEPIIYTNLKIFSWVLSKTSNQSNIQCLPEQVAKSLNNWRNQLQVPSPIPLPYFCLVAGGRLLFKRYRRWHNILNTILSNTDLKVVVIDNKSNMFNVDFDAIIHKNRVIDLIGKTTIGELFGILKHASFVLGNDTGPTHISALLGKNTYCITTPAGYMTFWPWPTWLASTSIFHTQPTTGCNLNQHCCHNTDSDGEAKCLKEVNDNEIINKICHDNAIPPKIAKATPEKYKTNLHVLMPILDDCPLIPYQVQWHERLKAFFNDIIWHFLVWEGKANESLINTLKLIPEIKYETHQCTGKNYDVAFINVMNELINNLNGIFEPCDVDEFYYFDGFEKDIPALIKLLSKPCTVIQTDTVLDLHKPIQKINDNYYIPIPDLIDMSKLIVDQFNYVSMLYKEFFNFCANKVLLCSKSSKLRVGHHFADAETEGNIGRVYHARWWGLRRKNALRVKIKEEEGCGPDDVYFADIIKQQQILTTINGMDYLQIPRLIPCSKIDPHLKF